MDYIILMSSVFCKKKNKWLSNEYNIQKPHDFRFVIRFCYNVLDLVNIIFNLLFSVFNAYVNPPISTKIIIVKYINISIFFFL